MEEEGPVNSRLCSTSRLYPAASGQTRTRRQTRTGPQWTPPTEGGMMLNPLVDKKKAHQLSTSLELGSPHTSTMWALQSSLVQSEDHNPENFSPLSSLMFTLRGVRKQLLGVASYLSPAVITNSHIYSLTGAEGFLVFLFQNNWWNKLRRTHCALWPEKRVLRGGINSWIRIRWKSYVRKVWRLFFSCFLASQ